MPAWVNIPSAAYAEGAPVASSAFAGNIVGDLNFLYANQVSAQDAGGVPLVCDGSFEAQAALTPGASLTNWVFAPGTGATGTVVNTYQNHGANSFQFTQGTVGGNTGGTLTSANFMNVSPSMPFLLSFMLYSSRTDVQNKVVMNWYNSSGIILSSTTIYDSGAGGGRVAWIVFGYILTPPPTAAFSKLILYGGANGGSPPASQASIYFDGISSSRRAPLSIVSTFTSSGTFTVPPGVFFVALEFFDNTSRSGIVSFQYSKRTLPVNPGDTITITSTGGATTANYNGTIFGYNSNVDVFYQITGGITLTLAAKLLITY